MLNVPAPLFENLSNLIAGKSILWSYRILKEYFVSRMSYTEMYIWLVGAGQGVSSLVATYATKTTHTSHKSQKREIHTKTKTCSYPPVHNSTI